MPQHLMVAILMVYPLLQQDQVGHDVWGSTPVVEGMDTFWCSSIGCPDNGRTTFQNHLVRVLNKENSKSSNKVDDNTYTPLTEEDVRELYLRTFGEQCCSDAEVDV